MIPWLSQRCAPPRIIRHATITLPSGSTPAAGAIAVTGACDTTVAGPNAPPAGRTDATARNPSCVQRATASPRAFAARPVAEALGSLESVCGADHALFAVGVITA